MMPNDISALDFFSLIVHVQCLEATSILRKQTLFGSGWISQLLSPVIVVKSAEKPVYNVHKAVFTKNLLDFSDDFARSTARSQF